MVKKPSVENGVNRLALAVFFGVILTIFASFSAYAASMPQPPTINVTLNETRGLTPLPGALINTSGGYITTLNLSARVQNTRWKAFVGWVTGKFALDSADGSTIYDWNSATTQGNVYATRNSSIVLWASVGCASNASINAEGTLINQTNIYDNLTATFSSYTHPQIGVGAITIPANTCHSAHTYINNATQSGNFHEVVLSDGGGLIYATIIESGGHVGFDGKTYDFQMIVPENGGRTWTGSTAYYLYVELV